MHSVLRSYSGSGSKELFELFETRKAELEQLLRGIKGFVSYALVRSGDGGFSVSVYQDKAGSDESVRVAKDWVAKQAGGLGVKPPTLSEGTVVLHLI